MRFRKLTHVSLPAELQLILVDPEDELIVLWSWRERVIPGLLYFCNKCLVSELSELRVVVNAVFPVDAFDWIHELTMVLLSVIEHVWI